MTLKQHFYWLADLSCTCLSLTLGNPGPGICPDHAHMQTVIGHCAVAYAVYCIIHSHAAQFKAVLQWLQDLVYSTETVASHDFIEINSL